MNSTYEFTLIEAPKMKMENFQGLKVEKKNFRWTKTKI